MADLNTPIVLQGDVITNNGIAPGSAGFVDFRPTLGGQIVRAVDQIDLSSDGGDLRINSNDARIAARDCSLYAGFIKTNTNASGRTAGTVENNALGNNPRNIMDLDNVLWKVVRDGTSNLLGNGTSGFGEYIFTNSTIEISENSVPGSSIIEWPGFGPNSRYRFIADGLRLVNLDPTGNFEFHLRASTNDSTIAGFQPVGAIGVQIKANQALLGSDWRESVGSEVNTNQRAVMRVTPGIGGLTNNIGSAQRNISNLNALEGNAQYQQVWSVTTNDNFSAQINNQGSGNPTSAGTGLDILPGIILYLLNPTMPNTSSLWMVSGTSNPTSASNPGQSRMCIAYRPNFILGDGTLVNDFYISSSANIEAIREIPSAYDVETFPPIVSPREDANGTSFSIESAADYGNGLIIEVDRALVTDRSALVNGSLDGSRLNGNTFSVKSYLYNNEYVLPIPSTGTELVDSVSFGSNTSDITVTIDPFTAGTTRSTVSSQVPTTLLELYRIVKEDWVDDSSQDYSFDTLVTDTSTNTLTIDRDVVFETGSLNITTDVDELRITTPTADLNNGNTFNALAVTGVHDISWYPGETITIGVNAPNILFDTVANTFAGSAIIPDTLIDGGDNNSITINGRILVHPNGTPGAPVDRSFTIDNADISGLVIDNAAPTAGTVFINFGPGVIGVPTLSAGVVLDSTLTVNIINNDPVNQFSLLSIAEDGSATSIFEASNVGDTLTIGRGDAPGMVSGLNFRIVWSGPNRRAAPVNGSITTSNEVATISLSDVSYPTTIDISSVNTFTSTYNPVQTTTSGPLGELDVRIDYVANRFLDSGLAVNRWLRENIVGTSAYNLAVAKAGRDLISSEGATGPATADGEFITIYPLLNESIVVGGLLNSAANPAHLLQGSVGGVLSDGNVVTFSTSVLQPTNFNLAATTNSLTVAVNDSLSTQTIDLNAEILRVVSEELDRGTLTSIGR